MEDIEERMGNEGKKTWIDASDGGSSIDAGIMKRDK